ncbi:SPFH domain-containing protein, partial [Anaerotignum sp.]|uniref:SPFH domain-containing protein n=1 Tax=Anaerotignum sp. TaxID=2039241 RepID=UPI00289CE81D
MTLIKKKISKKLVGGISLALVLFIATLVVYKVDTTEYAVVTQFGNPVSVDTTPGLKVKLPDPIQSVQRLDKRIQVYQTTAIELLTLDKKSVSLDYYGTWKIVDPVLYLKTVQTQVGAESRLLDVFSSSLGVQLGKYNLEQLVNTAPEKLQLSQLVEDAVTYAKERATSYGIEVVDAQIRVLNFP